MSRFNTVKYDNGQMIWVKDCATMAEKNHSFSAGVVAAIVRICVFARCRWRIHKKWRWMEYNGFCFRLCRAEIYIDNKSTYKFPPWAPTWDLIPVPPSPRHCDHHDHFPDHGDSGRLRKVKEAKHQSFPLETDNHHRDMNIFSKTYANMMRTNISSQKSWTNIFAATWASPPSSCSPKPTCDSRLLTFLSPRYLTLFKINNIHFDDALEKVPRKSIEIRISPKYSSSSCGEICTEKVPSRFHWISPAVFVFQITVWPGPGLCQQPLGQGHLSPVTSHFSNLSNHLSLHLVLEVQFNLTWLSSILFKVFSDMTWESNKWEMLSKLG